MSKTPPSASAGGTITPGAKLRAAITAEHPLQVVGTINAYHARMAERVGYRAIYLSGGDRLRGVAHRLRYLGTTFVEAKE